MSEKINDGRVNQITNSQFRKGTLSDPYLTAQNDFHFDLTPNEMC